MWQQKKCSKIISTRSEECGEKTESTINQLFNGMIVIVIITVRLIFTWDNHFPFQFNRLDESVGWEKEIPSGITLHNTKNVERATMWHGRKLYSLHKSEMMFVAYDEDGSNDKEILIILLKIGTYERTNFIIYFWLYMEMIISPKVGKATTMTKMKAKAEEMWKICGNRKKVGWV